ncbi:MULTISPECIES: glycosyltransferase [Planktothrix]|uniref:glycosyltransferase n=1 Tax=Planktothrix TaxID=54304 RepID=UPI0003FE6D32|nr:MULTISPECIES: glycosyltransferase family A protein [Planktothrix]
MSKISAVICTYNRYDLLEKAIHSLKQQTLNSDLYRILVIDNSPDLEYAEQVKQHYDSQPFLEYVIEPKPGLSNARNVAAHLCNTEFIAYMDDDAIADPNWLEHILVAFQLFGQEAAVVGGSVEPLWPEERPSWLDDSLLGYVSVVDWGGETRIAKPREWFAGTNIAFRTEEILNRGGFDVTLGRTGGGAVLLSNEETHLLEQIKQDGKLAIYAPEARVHHLVEQKRLKQSWFRQRVAWQSVSDYMMNPEVTVADAKKDWNFILEYFFGLPPRYRTIKGLFYDTDDPNKFRQQLSVLSAVTTLMLTGFEDIE